MNKNQSVKDFLQAGDEIELMVDDYGYHGEGIGHWQGQAIFIPQALKGEKVKVQILKVKKNFAQGLLKEVLSYHREDKNPRTVPSCPYYDLCGGCQLQHMVYEEQLFLKSNLLYNNLRRLAGLDRSELADILPSPEVLHYRNRAQFHFFFNEDKNKRPDLGFFAESSHQAFHLEQCLLLQPVLNDFLTFLQKKLPSYGQKLVGLKDIVVQTDYLGEKIGLTLVTEKRNPIYGQLLADLSLDYPQLAFAAHNINQGGGLFGDIWPIGSDCGFLPEKIGHLSFALAPGSFLQVNSRQTLNLYNIVKRFADIQKDEKVLDIYCGIGTISLFLGEEAGEIWGIEEFAPAILAAEANASANNIKNSHFIAGKAEEILPEYQENGYYWDKIILDPPRQGCRPEVIAAICAIAPKKIVYVSCDSATLARDLKIFADKNYRVEAIQPVDMFPQTRHVECVCLMSKAQK